ncbi:MAG: hypothetical protein FWE24_11300 [Defluviitaleaceae bacterium]|nr:hypothetical protein [Defluviitaleaceae bacterium]
MQSILEELYHGNIRHDVKYYGQDSAFVKAARTKHDCMEKLAASLGDSEKELLEKYYEAQSGIESIARFDTFTYALRLGILLMIEVFKNDNQEPTVK